MHGFQAVLLDVWRETCRHIDIAESAATIGTLLAREMPLDCLLLRKIDVEKNALETVARTPTAESRDDLPTRTDCSPAQMKRIVAWLRENGACHIPRSAPPPRPVDLMVPTGLECDMIVAPLAGPPDCLGVMILVATPGARFSETHVRLSQMLLDPLSVALEKNGRLRQIVALQEAAEADKRSLLARLGRDQLGDTIIGSQSGLSEVFARVQLVARSDAPVMIFGETGSGKELIARAIHSRSPRTDKPFIRVNCGAIPTDLIDSQLFGHEKGAFTGAVNMHRGWFERADGGTLLLDEVAELPPAAQVRLLRILQDGWLERVGGHEQIHVDVRIVAATHRDLAAMVADGRFRHDLWYRIAVFPIVLPPLRHRLEDIPELARHFAGRAATRFGLAPTMPTPEDIALMVTYDWPGNVRELASVIDRAAILGDGARLEIAKALGVTRSMLPTAAPGAGQPTAAPSSEIASLNSVMKQHIEAALRKTGGRVEGRNGAATILEINPNTLRARMRKLRIDWKAFRV